MGLILRVGLIVCREGGGQQIADRPEGGGGTGAVCETNCGRHRRLCLQGSSERKQMCHVIKTLQRESGSSSESWERGHAVAVVRQSKDGTRTIFTLSTKPCSFKRASLSKVVFCASWTCDRETLMSPRPAVFHRCSFQSFRCEFMGCWIVERTWRSSMLTGSYKEKKKGRRGN